jgi:hypothetical protein
MDAGPHRIALTPLCVGPGSLRSGHRRWSVRAGSTTPSCSRACRSHRSRARGCCSGRMRPCTRHTRWCLPCAPWRTRRRCECCGSVSLSRCPCTRHTRWCLPCAPWRTRRRCECCGSVSLSRCPCTRHGTHAGVCHAHHGGPDAGASAVVQSVSLDARAHGTAHTLVSAMSTMADQTQVRAVVF